jgi:DNA polymerase-3 subunit delta'
MIIGHQKITDFLNKSIVKNRLAHAYLFIGQEHLGKKTVALDFVKSLECQNRNGQNLSFCDKCVSCQEINKNSHPDILIVKPEMIEEKGKKREQEIGIEKIRDIQRQVSLFSFRGGYKIIIIDSAEKMTRQAANALLKTLEEPSKKTIFILISSSPRALLSTIISRCLMIKFSLVESKIIEKALNKIGGVNPKISLEKIIRFSSGKPGLAIAYLNQPELINIRERTLKEIEVVFKKDLNSRFQYAENLAKDLFAAQSILNNWLFYFRDMILIKNGCDELTFGESGKEKKEVNSISNIKLTEITRKIMETKRNLANPSFNARLALEVLMLSVI